MIQKKTYPITYYRLLLIKYLILKHNHPHLTIHQFLEVVVKLLKMGSDYDNLDIIVYLIFNLNYEKVINLQKNNTISSLDQVMNYFIKNDV